MQGPMFINFIFNCTSSWSQGYNCYSCDVASSPKVCLPAARSQCLSVETVGLLRGEDRQRRLSWRSHPHRSAPVLTRAGWYKAGLTTHCQLPFCFLVMLWCSFSRMPGHWLLSAIIIRSHINFFSVDITQHQAFCYSHVKWPETNILLLLNS